VRSMCRRSQIRLQVTKLLQILLQCGLGVSIPSNDPAYFGGYGTAHDLAAHQALGFELTDIVQ